MDRVILHIDMNNFYGSVETLYDPSLREVPMAVGGGAVVAGAYDAAAMAKRISAEGFVPVARIHAFRDSIAPRFSRDAAVGYFDTEWSWLDNSVELGGKPWLNPYSKEARDYLSAIVEELSESGFERIIVDSVQFPSGVGLDKAGYGDTGGVSKSDCLRSFLGELEASAKPSGTVVSVYFSGPNALSDNELLYGGRALSLVNASAAVGMMPAAFSKDSVIGGETVADIADEAELIGVLQANDAAGNPLAAAELQKQIRALRESGVENMILYHPNGTYPFS